MCHALPHQVGVATRSTLRNSDTTFPFPSSHSDPQNTHATDHLANTCSSKFIAAVMIQYNLQNKNFLSKEVGIFYTVAKLLLSEHQLLILLESRSYQ